MPEGDTIVRTARTLDRTLAGRTVTSVVFVSFRPSICRPAERWMRPRHEMRIVIGTGDVEAVAFELCLSGLHISFPMGPSSRFRSSV